MTTEQADCSKTSAYKIQTLGNCPEKAYNIQNKSKVWNQENSASRWLLL